MQFDFPLPQQRHPRFLAGLTELCRFLRKNCDCKNMAEVGVFLGEATVFFSALFDKVYAIDPFISGYDPKDASSSSDFDKVKNQFYTYVKFIPNIVVVEEKSIKVPKLLVTHGVKEASLDFVYLDGLHTYEGITEDIEAWLPMVKRPGLIGGHDFGYPTFPGIQKAVEEKFGKPDVLFQDGSWVVRI